MTSSDTDGNTDSPREDVDPVAKEAAWLVPSPVAALVISAAIIGSLFAKSRYITLGPTNATSVMLLSAFASIFVLG